MSNGHAGTNHVVETVSNGIPSPSTNLLHYINPFSLENGTVSKVTMPFCPNGSRCWQQRLGVSYQRQRQWFRMEGTMETGATAIPVPLKRPLPLGTVAVGAHLCPLVLHLG